MEIVDANIILRFILDDDKELSDKASEIIENKKNIYFRRSSCRSFVCS